MAAKPGTLRKLSLATVPVAALLLTACQTGTDPTASASLDSDLNELLSWFPGVYDNTQQVSDERSGNLTSDLRHRHTNHTFYPVEIAGIPGRQLYAQQYQHYDPDDLYRQRVYAFETDLVENAVRLTIYTPKDPRALTDLHHQPETQAAMSADDFILKPGCEVYWTRAEDQFEGYLKPMACSYYSSRFETQVFLEETLVLRQDALLLNDRAVDADGKLVFGVDDKGPTVNLKQAERTALDVELQALTRLLQGDYFSDADGGAREGRPIYQRIRNITPPDGRSHAMYSEMRHDGPNGDYYRQLIYLFDEAPDRTENRMQALRVAAPEVAATLIEAPDALATGIVETTSAISDTCYTVWEQNADGFSGWIDPQRCVITGKRGDQRRIESRTQIMLSAIGQLERGFSIEGTLLFGTPTDDPYIWPRVEPGSVEAN